MLQRILRFCHLFASARSLRRNPGSPDPFCLFFFLAHWEKWRIPFLTGLKSGFSSNSSLSFISSMAYLAIGTAAVSRWFNTSQIWAWARSSLISIFKILDRFHFIYHLAGFRNNCGYNLPYGYMATDLKRFCLYFLWYTVIVKVCHHIHVRATFPVCSICHMNSIGVAWNWINRHWKRTCTLIQDNGLPWTKMW